MTQLDKKRWEALRPLLHAALEMPPDARPAWLAEQRKSEPSLVAELEELLNSESEADRQEFLGTRGQPRLPEGPSSLAGQVLGAYVLERPLGEGGMGTVWLARRRDGRFEGFAAIKFLRLAVAGPSGETRFRREGSVLARLTHPNIARLLDAGVTPAGQPYLVLEHVDGAPLDDWCDQRQLPVEARLRLFQQVLAAVSEAHTNLIVHRDLKPSNILVTGDGTVKLLDFGIAKLLEDGASDPTALTGSQERVLTFQYAAPEQVVGDPISTATDVYSLGVLLYQLLTGRHPTSASCRTPADHIKAVLTTEPTQLSKAVTPSGALSRDEALRLATARATSPDRLRRVYAGDLDNILAKALRKTPAERYSTVAAFSDDLERYLQHEPVAARPTTWTYRAGKFARRNRGAVTSAVLVALALIGAAVVTGFQAREARRQRDSAIQNAKRQKALSNVQLILATDFRGVDGKLLSGTERSQLALHVLERTYRLEPWLVAEGMTSMANRYLITEEFGALRSVLTRAEAIARRADLPGQLASALCFRAFTFVHEFQLDSARAALAEAKAALKRPEARSDGDAAVTCLQTEGFLYTVDEHPDSAIAPLISALARIRADSGTGAVNESSPADILNFLGAAFEGTGQWREAYRAHWQAVTEMDANGYGDSGFIEFVAQYLFADLWQLGEFAAADSCIRSLVQEREAIHGAGRAGAELAFEYGIGKLRLGDLDSADVWLSRAMQVTGDPHTEIPFRAPLALAQLRLDQGRLAEAHREILQLPMNTRVGRRSAPLFRARVLWQRGDSAAAIATLEDGIRALPDTDPVTPDRAVAFITAGEWRLATGDGRAADSLAVLARVMAAVDSLALTRSGLVGRAELLRSRALRARGDSVGARDGAERALVAIANGYGPDNRFTAEARTFRDSLSH